MNNVFVYVAGRDDVASVLKALRSAYRTSEVSQGRYIVEPRHLISRLGARISGAGSHLWIDANEPEDPLNDRTESEVTLLRQLGHRPTELSVEFSKGTSLARNVLERITSVVDSVVDTDNGLVISGKEFQELLASYPRWDWRLVADPRERLAAER